MAMLRIATRYLFFLRKEKVTEKKLPLTYFALCHYKSLAKNFNSQLRCSNNKFLTLALVCDYGQNTSAVLFTRA